MEFANLAMYSTNGTSEIDKEANGEKKKGDLAMQNVAVFIV